MSALGEVWRRVGMLLRRRAPARELDEEMRLHREMNERELIEGGEERDGARYSLTIWPVVRKLPSGNSGIVPALPLRPRFQRNSS
jgi:hypothetical protein